MKPKYLTHLSGEQGRYWHLWQVDDFLIGLPERYFPEGFTGPMAAFHPNTKAYLVLHLPDNYWDDLFVKQPPSQVIPDPENFKLGREKIVGVDDPQPMGKSGSLLDVHFKPSPMFESQSIKDIQPVEKIDIKLVLPEEEDADPQPPRWRCNACGNRDGFNTVQHEAGDFDVECAFCGSRDTEEDGLVEVTPVKELPRPGVTVVQNFGKHRDPNPYCPTCNGAGVVVRSISPRERYDDPYLSDKIPCPDCMKGDDDERDG
jgi:hypothetical protein